MNKEEKELLEAMAKAVVFMLDKMSKNNQYDADFFMYEYFKREIEKL